MRRLALVSLIVTSAFAQLGDKAGEAQIQQVPPERIPPSPALSPQDEAKTFQIAPGFRIELVASEPLVGDPVAARFGPDGRLWVVEMRSYMPDLDGTHEDKPTGRVVVLTDTDGDGKMDKSDVFLDQLVMPRAICLVGDGALIGAPPMLWYCPDKNHDGKADEKIEVARDFGIQTDPSRPELANPERAPNAPLWALDNWIYCGAYAAKFRFRGGTFERGVSSFRGQWGLSQDDWGHLFHNSNSDHLRGDIAPSHYLIRNPHFPRPAGANVKVAAEQFVWPIRVNPGINRGYRPEMLRDYRLKEFTAACAPWIYRGDLLGCYGDAFICEPSANLVSRDVLTAERGTLAARPAYVQREFLASQDERFRPVNLTTGPDGALYIVDFYRGVIQHRISLTTYLRKQSEARGLADPRGLGRIWRVVPEGRDGAPRRPLNLAKLTSAELVPHLASPNSWTRETAQRLLVERADVSVVPVLEQLALKGEPLAKLHALWTLDGMQKSSWPVLGAALADPDARVRNAAVRCCESLFAGDARENAVAKLIALTATESDPQVQLQLALTLGEAREAKADTAIAALALRAPNHPFLADAVLSGVAGRELELLEHLLAEKKAAGKVGARLLGGLARCIAAERKPERITRFLALAQPLPATQRNTLLAGFAFDAATAARRPVKLDAKPALLDDPAASKVATMLTWPGKPAPAGFKPPRALTADEQTRFDTGKALYAGVCAACHQPHGMGLDGLAPPLLDSEWVLGSPDRLARIALHGVRGPLKVKGTTYSLDMPPMGIFGDDQLAAILTYIRREWEHGAEPISPEQVKTIRAAEAKRQDSWTQEELLKLP